MRISDLAQRTGCHLETVRYYEKIGLLPAPARLASGYRAYAEADVDRLRFIVRSRALGFGLDDIRTLLKLARHGEMPCADVDVLATAQLRQVEEKIQELQALAGQLERLLGSCTKQNRSECRILGALGGAELRSPSGDGAASIG